jgi:hypothetical protein
VHSTSFVLTSNGCGGWLRYKFPQNLHWFRDVIFENFRVRMMPFYLMKLYPLSNFDPHISANIGATNKPPSTDPLQFGQRREFGPHQDVIDIFQ